MRSSAKTLLLIVALAAVVLSGCNKLRARDELNKGVRAYKGGNFEEAINHFQAAINHDPTLINARVYLATAYASQFVPGSPSEENKKIGEAAINEFQKVLEQDKGNITALSYIAQLYFGQAGAANAKWEDAQALFAKSKEYRRKLIEVDPKNPEHYYSIGVIDWTLAYRPRMQLRADRKLQPDATLAPRDRAQLAEENSAIVEEGIDVLQKALELNPKYLDAIAYLNLMYREKAALASDPKERDALLERADELHERYQRLREEQTQGAAAPAPTQ